MKVSRATDNLFVKRSYDLKQEYSELLFSPDGNTANPNLTEQQKTAIGEAEDEATEVVSEGGFAPFSETWYQAFWTAYEFLMDQ